MKIGDRVRTEDGDTVGIVVERYSGQKPGMRGKLRVVWGGNSAEWTWEDAGDLTLAPEERMGGGECTREAWCEIEVEADSLAYGTEITIGPEHYQRILEALSPQTGNLSEQGEGGNG